jgi:hypothetical protein
VTGDRDEARKTRWVDLQSAVTRTGMTREHIIWAMASGDVRFSTSLRDHHGVPKLALVDVESLARRLPTSEPVAEDPPEPERMTGTPGRVPSSRDPRD